MAKLYLVELTPSTDVRSLMSDLADNARANGAELIEAQVTADRSRVFAILEADDPAGVVAATSDLAAEACEPAQVRLVGAELADIKAVRPEAGYLVEWDIPASIPRSPSYAPMCAKTWPSACASTTHPMSTPSCTPAKWSPRRSTVYTRSITSSFEAQASRPRRRPHR